MPIQNRWNVRALVSPVALRAWAAEVRWEGFRVVDAPVSGGDVGAQDGTLSIMAGGTPEDIERLRGPFGAMGTMVRHMGPLGSGQLAKACNQVVVATVAWPAAVPWRSSGPS